MQLPIEVSQVVWASGERIDLAPSSPGLYAWYAVPIAGREDWLARLDPDTGEDQGRAAFLRFLTQWTQWHAESPLVTFAKQSFLREWQGSLQPRERVATGLEAVVDTDGRPISQLLEHEKLRRAAAKLILALIPLLAPPLYIGMADQLRMRLSQHVNGLVRNVRAQSEADRPQTTFAQRAAGCGLSPADLHYIAVPIQSAIHENLNRAEAVTVLRSVEYLANRTWMPSLGEV